MACVGKQPASACIAAYKTAHFSYAFLFFFSSAIFGLRATVLVGWYRPIIIPLWLFGLALVIFTIQSAIGDDVELVPGINETVCFTQVSRGKKALLIFLMASFDLVTALITFVCLYRTTAPRSWLHIVLFQEQVSKESKRPPRRVQLG